MTNSNFASTGARFLQNRRFRKSSEQTLILESFSEAKTTQNREKHDVEKHLFLLGQFFSTFLRFVSFLAQFWESPGPRKIEKNYKKSIF